jgi:hypothetical protein
LPPAKLGLRDRVHAVILAYEAAIVVPGREWSVVRASVLAGVRPLRAARRRRGRRLRSAANTKSTTKKTMPWTTKKTGQIQKASHAQRSPRRNAVGAIVSVRTTATAAYVVTSHWASRSVRGRVWSSA